MEHKCVNNSDWETCHSMSFGATKALWPVARMPVASGQLGVASGQHHFLKVVIARDGNSLCLKHKEH